MKNIQVEKLGNIPTPFYYYDIELLQETLAAILRETSESENYHIHYAPSAPGTAEALSLPPSRALLPRPFCREVLSRGGEGG